MNARFIPTRREQGIGLVTAVFLLVVLAGLGVAMVSIFRAQQATTTLDVMGVRAYLAARAGAEWGIYQQRIVNSCAPSTTFAMPAGTSLTGFSVTVNCTQVTQAGINRYRVTATACNPPGAGGCPNVAVTADYVQRVVDVRFGE
jgi:MSHA biogenesis protein MshP